MKPLIVTRQMHVDDSIKVAQIHTQAWQQAYQGIVPQAFLDAIDVNKRAENWRKGIETNDPNLLRLVSVMGNEITGFVCGLSNRDVNRLQTSDCELWAIYVDPSKWNTGSGRVLLEAFKASLAPLGKKNMCVWVLKDNLIGRRFYERTGGELSAITKEINIGDVPLIEVAYEYKLGGLIV